MTWKRLTGERAVDPDFYVEEGKDAVYVETGLARRVYGWNGRMWPRLSLCVYKGWLKTSAKALEGDSFKLGCSYKSSQGQWWHTVDAPLSLVDDVIEMMNEVKTSVSNKREGK